MMLAWRLLPTLFTPLLMLLKEGSWVWPRPGLLLPGMLYLGRLFRLDNGANWYIWDWPAGGGKGKVGGAGVVSIRVCPGTEEGQEKKGDIPFPMAEGGGNTGACWWEKACVWTDGWPEVPGDADEAPATGGAADAAGGTGRATVGSVWPASACDCGFHEDMLWWRSVCAGWNGCWFQITGCAGRAGVRDKGSISVFPA